MQEMYRCHHCKWILYKSDATIDVEIICPKCRRVNYPARKDSGLGLRGKDFQAKAIDHNCYTCNKLLLRSIGLGLLETKCFWCKIIIEFDTTLMRSGRFKHPKIVNKEKEQLEESLAR